MRHHAIAAAMGLLTAALLAPGSQSQAASADPTGYWKKPDAERESKIQVFKCGQRKNLLCAKIIWLKDPKDSKGRPLHDIRNQDASMRDRPIVGLTIFAGLAPSAPSTWTGKIYNPEDGNTYTATLTVLSRKEIKLRGCKAWLLCGEKQWLRTTAPEELAPAAPAEGTQQIEASVTPSSPPSAPSPAESVAGAEPVAAPSVEAAASEAPSGASAPQSEMQAMADPEASAEPQSTEALPKPVVLVTQEIATPAAPPAEYNVRRGYGFLNVSAGPETAARLSGENVSSMFVMTEPIAADAVAPISGQAAAVHSSVPLPEQKPKAKAKPIATAAAKPVPNTATPAKPAEQGAPAPQDADTAQTDADGAEASEAATAEAAMAESAPLTRRQKRAMRRQQEPDPFLPWLR
ncbi:MAG: DUF2147 domain-containing protein [Methyloceanibacter sp.]